MSKRTLAALGILAAITASFAGPAFAVEEVNVVSGLTAAGKPLGLHGRDVVALMRGEGAKKGSAAFTAVH